MLKIRSLFLPEKIYILKNISLCPGKTDTPLLTHRVYDIYKYEFYLRNLRYF